jgi:long-chain acyl-CoA synthetase
MVLSRLRILGSDDEPASRSSADGFPLTFNELLEYCSRTWGDKVAFQQKARREWTRMSHRDVHNRAHELAAGFAALGIKHGDRVAIVLENGVDWLCAYYGVVLNGAVGVPVYYDLKPSEIEEMLERAEPKMAVVSAKVLAKIRPALSRLQTVIVSGDGAAAALEADRSLLSLDDVAGRATHDSRRRVAALDVQPDDLASIVFTSGTSAGPKGVMLTHRNFMANCRSVHESIPIGERDRLVVVLPMHHAFPFMIAAIVAPFVGGEVTFENDLRRIRDRMAEVKPTLFAGVPALFELMYRNVVQRIEAEGRLDAFVRGVRIVEAS